MCRLFNCGYYIIHLMCIENKKLYKTALYYECGQECRLGIGKTTVIYDFFFFLFVNINIFIEYLH